MKNNLVQGKTEQKFQYIPCSTYRLQFNRGFTLKDATELLPYLKELGITDCYASPLFTAAPESTHGYDVCAFDQLNPNLGTDAEFEMFTSKLSEHGMGLILDLVPNHMGTDLSNHWFVDVLENGRHSPFATYFDIDWQPLKSDLHDKIILPILGDHYGNVLEKGELQLVSENGEFKLAYYDKHFPISPESYDLILEELFKKAFPDDRTKFGDILAARQSKHLEMSDRSSGKTLLKQLEQAFPSLNNAVGAVLNKFNGKVESARSFDPLHQLLGMQHYRLAYWKLGPQEINYRRFFDVNSLISVRMELPEVFEAAHRLVFRWVAQGKVTGLRIDHPDGLWDPEQYLTRLREKISKTSSDSTTSSLYVIAEKILTKNELLPVSWPVEGTTGYDFLNRLNGIFVESANATAFSSFYHEFIGATQNFSDVVHCCKRKILDESMASELTALTHRLKRVALRTRYGQDFSFKLLNEALREIVAAFPVYRTYISERSSELGPIEISQVEAAVNAAGSRNPKTDNAVFEFIKRLLLLQGPEDLDETGKQHCHEFVMKFQQLTSPVMAKGVEDTAFYRYNRLVSLNEVGGCPEEFGTSLEQFHQHNLIMAAQWPHSMLTTATHDTKRGEDVRARINVLSEMPEQWKRFVERWASANAKYKTVIGDISAPSKNDEYLLYQTLIGTWPFEWQSPTVFEVFRKRLLAYMIKAMREAKLYTSWSEPNIAYEQGVITFITRILDDKNPFLKDFCEFQRIVAAFGVYNSLSQVLLRITAPGVCDTYQGAELWDLSMVDPDNRRHVDFKLRREMLSNLLTKLGTSPPDLGKLPEDIESGLIKLFVVHRALNFRRQHRTLFENGSYEPLQADGKQRKHICAFSRSLEGQTVVTVVPRFVYSLNSGQPVGALSPGVWENTWLPLPFSAPGEKLCNVFTGKILPVESQNSAPTISLSTALAEFPVALLMKV